MSSEFNQNPYSLGTAAERSEVAWTDGDVEFTEKEIRVLGDFELPQICIRTGSSEIILRREQTVIGLSPTSYRVQWFIIVIALVPILASTTSGLLNNWFPTSINTVLNLLREATYIRLCILVLLLGASLLPNWIGHKAKIVWYLSREYTSTMSARRKWLVPTIIGFGGSCGVLISLQDNRFRELYFVAAAGIVVVATRLFPMERGIHCWYFENKRFILKGHSAEFAHAWAADTATEPDSRRVRG
jgi:hypothetical protein